MLNDTLNKISRLMFILNELDKGLVCLLDIADELSVNVRTIQRDIRILETAGFPISNPYKGSYCFVEGYSLKKMDLNPQEAAMLALLSSIAESLGGNFQNTYTDLCEHILDRNTQNPFYIKIPKGQTFLNSEISAVLEQSIKQRKKVKINYENSKLSGKNISPLKIAWYDGFWYLLALGKNDIILKLRLDKIKEAEITDENFTRPKKVEKILEESTSVWFDPKNNITAELEISPKAAKYFEKKKYFPKQKILSKTSDGGLILQCSFGRCEEVLPTILAWLPHIVVKSPDELAERLYKILDEYREKVK